MSERQVLPDENPPDRVWLITGASSGFGRAIADAALAAGDTVVGTARRTEALDDLVARAPDGRAAAVALDLAVAGRAPAVVHEVLDRFGRIDVLVNNAGYGAVGAVEETSDDDLRAHFEVHVFGPTALVRAVLPGMRTRRRGAIVQMSSYGGQVGAPGFGSYCGTKFALEGLSEALAAEVAPYGIQVLIVEPGAFRTGFGASGMRRAPAMAAYDETVGPTRRAVDAMDGTQPGDPAKAARAILRALAADDPPLRLPLGQDAVAAIRTHLAMIDAELRAWEPVSLDTLLP